MSIDFQNILRNSPLKVTPKRLAMLDILAAKPTYLCAEDMWKRLKERFTNMGLPTVYRNLESLTNENIIMKITHPDRKLYYYFCHNTDHHHHFICTKCKKVEDLAFCGMEKIEEEVRQRLKGSVTSHLLQVFGYCKECTPEELSLRRQAHL